MSTKNTSAFLKYCAIFSGLLSVSLWGLCYLLDVNFPLYLMMLVFFISFALSFLFFNFFYQKIIFGRIDETINKIREFRPLDSTPDTVDFVSDVSDPIERFNEEIIHLSNERQKEVEHLKKLENYRKEFLGNVSHELKTPIFNIQGYLETLLDGGLEDDSVNANYISKAKINVERMISIVDDLEAISQLEAEKFDLVEMLKEIFESHRSKTNTKQITLSLRNPEEKNIFVVADKFRIRQVISNLISNSVKYGKENGETTVKAIEMGEKI